MKTYINIKNIITIATCRLLLGARAFKQLLFEKPTTKKALYALATRFLRKGKTIKETMAAADTVLRLIKEGKKDRELYRKSRGRKPLVDPKNVPWSSIPYSLPCGSIHQRLRAYHDKLERERLNAARVRFYRLLGGKRTNTQSVIRLPEGAPLADVNAKAWCEKGENYSSRCSFPMSFASFQVFMPHDFEETVTDCGLAEVHGMLTLAALKVETGRQGEEAWRAKWVSKGRGFSFVVTEGFILRRDNQIAHGPTLATARSTLTRRATEFQLERHETELMAKLEGPSGQLGNLSSIMVSMDDSICAGNCGSGTRAFRDSHFPGRNKATVHDILSAAHLTSERRLAIAACMVAIRRHETQREKMGKVA